MGKQISYTYMILIGVHSTMNLVTQLISCNYHVHVHISSIQMYISVTNQGSIQDSKFGGEAIVDNAAVGGGDVFPPVRSVKLKYFTTWLSLKRLNFNSCVISTGIIELIKASLILYVLSLANHLGGKLGC